MNADDDILRRFPKERPALPPEYQSIYVSHYRTNRGGRSVASAMACAMESWMHRKVAEDVSHRLNRITRTLEVGAGTLNHLDYEPAANPYDIVEPFVELYSDSSNRFRVSTAYRDLNEIRGEHCYDRVVSIAVFEHLCDLPAVVGRCASLLKPDGVLRVAIPSEGTLLWSLGWHLTTGIEFRLKHRLDYGVLMRFEHVNTAAEIEAVLKAFFRSVRRSVFGLCAALSFYQFFECLSPREGQEKTF
jgi:SAM-dependent methyltransferase